MDECKNCIVRGDLDECLVTPCNIRESWFSIVMMERNAALTIDNAALKLEVDDMKRTLSMADIEIERSRKEAMQNSGEKVSVGRDHLEVGWRLPVFRVDR